MKTPDPGSFRIVQLGVDLVLPEGEAGEEGGSRGEGQFDEALPPAEDEPHLLPVTVERLLRPARYEDGKLPPGLGEEVEQAGPGGGAGARPGPELSEERNEEHLRQRQQVGLQPGVNLPTITTTV